MSICENDLTSFSSREVRKSVCEDLAMIELCGCSSAIDMCSGGYYSAVNTLRRLDGINEEYKFL